MLARESLTGASPRQTLPSVVPSAHPARLVVFLAAFFGLVGDKPAAAAAPVLFLFAGDSDQGVGAEFLELGRRRGAATLQEPAAPIATDPTVAAALARALESYQAMRLPEAVAAFDTLEQQILERSGGLSAGELADLYTFRAAARMAIGSDGDAWEDLLMLAAIAEGRPLDPARLPPRFIAAAARAASALPPPTKLVIRTLPADAVILVDGRTVGRGVAEVTRTPGRHWLRAVRSGFSPTAQILDLAPLGAEVTLKLSAHAAPSLTSTVARAQLVGATQALRAHLTVADGRLKISLALIDVVSARVIEHADVDANDQAGLAAMVDQLLGGHAPSRARPRRTALWISVGGAAVGIIALSIGLGVGLAPRGSGFVTHVELGAAR